MRFPIRNIFPRWQIWVHCLSVHSFHLLPFCCYVLSVAQLLLFSGDFGITRLHSGTTCILEHFFRTYVFPFVHSTKKRCRSTLHRSHMLKTVFVCALAGCISKAIPHNSKCRYGERGAADAKPKAQIILDAAKVSAASGGNSEPKQGQRSQSARGFCPRSTMRVPQPDIIEHFGNADAVPQPPKRCLSRKAGIVRCCPKTSTYHASFLPRGRNFYTM